MVGVAPLHEHKSITRIESNAGCEIGNCLLVVTLFAMNQTTIAIRIIEGRLEPNSF